MEEQFVPYELALKLKELAFNMPCLAEYDDKKFCFWDIDRHGILTNKIGQCNAPLWQQAFDWFRDKGLNAVIYIVEGHKWDWDIQDDNQEIDEIVFDLPLSETYIKARLICLEKLIEIYHDRIRSA